MRDEVAGIAFARLPEPDLQQRQRARPRKGLQQYAECERPDMQPLDSGDTAADERAEDEEENPGQMNDDDEVGGHGYPGSA